MAQNIGLDTKNKSLACSEPKLQFHSLKFSLASYSPSILFLTSRSSWGSWKWSQMICHTNKHWVWHHTQVSSKFRTKFTISLLDVLIGLLQHLHPVLDRQVNLKLMEVIPNDLPYTKTWVFYTKYKPIAYSEAKLHIFSFIHFDSLGAQFQNFNNWTEYVPPPKWSIFLVNQQIYIYINYNQS